MAEPDSLTRAEQIESAPKARRSLMFLLEAIERGDLAATPHEIARLQGAVEPLVAIVGEVGPARYLPASATTMGHEPCADPRRDTGRARQRDGFRAARPVRAELVAPRTDPPLVASLGCGADPLLRTDALGRRGAGCPPEAVPRDRAPGAPRPRAHATEIAM
jgi:hypothetical protein